MCAQLNNVKNLYQIWIQEARWWCLAVSDPYTSGCIFHMWSGYETSVTFLFWRQHTFNQGSIINMQIFLPVPVATCVPHPNLVSAGKVLLTSPQVESHFQSILA